MKMGMFGFQLLLLLALIGLDTCAGGASAEHDDDENGVNDSKEEDCQCPKEWKPHNGNCYRFVQDTVSTPDQAHEKAEKVGAHLVTIEDEAEDIYVKGLCADKLTNPKLKNAFDRITIGLLIVRSPDGDGTTIISVKRRFDLSESVYGNTKNPLYLPGKAPWGDGTGWGGTEPEPKKVSTANCVQLIRNSDSAFKWAAAPCDISTNNAGYVLKFKITTRTTWPENALCPKPGYTKRRGKCYKVSTTKTLTYEQADTACQADGGKLTAIHSESHLYFFKGLIVLAYPQPELSDKFVRFFTGFLGTRDSITKKFLSYIWKDGRISDLNGLFDPKRIGLYQGDCPWSDGTAYGKPDVPEPKEGPDATKGFLVVNSKTAAVFAVGPDPTNTDGFLGACICKLQATCPDGKTMTKGSCFGPTEVIPNGRE